MFIDLAAQPLKSAMSTIARSVKRPKVKVAINRAFDKKILGYRPPLAACRYNIHEAVDNFPFVNRPFSAAAFCGRDQWSDQLLPGIGQITGLT